MKIKTTFFALSALFILIGNSLALASFYPFPWPSQPTQQTPSQETPSEPSGETETTSGEGSR